MSMKVRNLQKTFISHTAHQVLQYRSEFLAEIKYK